MFRKLKSPILKGDNIPLLAIAAIFVSLVYFQSAGMKSLFHSGPKINQSENCWISAKEEIDRSIDDIMEQNRLESEKGIRFSKIVKGKENLPYIALTFDDGPHPKSTRQILQILQAEKVKATFFVVGKKVLQYPQLVRLQVENGHSIGNHTFNHINLKTASAELAATEIKACGKAIKYITGKAPHLFRPPGGNYNNEVVSIADALGYTTVLWTANAGDCGNISKEAIWDRIMMRTGNGGIILMHDGIQESTDMLPELIQRLKHKGYIFVTVNELIGIKNKASRKPVPALGFLKNENMLNWLSNIIAVVKKSVLNIILMPIRQHKSAD